MRRRYTLALPFLETRRGDEIDHKVPAAEVFLRAPGYTKEKVDQLQIASKSKEELIELIAHGPGRNASQTRAQTAVHSTELDAALLEGWFYRASLPGGRAIIERP